MRKERPLPRVDLRGDPVRLAGRRTGYVAWAAQRDDRTVPPSSRGSLARVTAEPHVVFAHIANGRSGEEVTLAALDHPDGRTGHHGPQVRKGALCSGPRAVPGPRGRCVQAGLHGQDLRDRVQDAADDRFRRSSEPRARVTGRAVRGHDRVRQRALLRSGDFSTKAVIIDMARGQGDRGPGEGLHGHARRKVISEVDFNFWGVTFARDSNRFYATLRTGDKTFLLEGDVAARRARVIRENAECPSISPDNTRVAYKKLIDGKWRFHVLDLEDGQGDAAGGHEWSRRPGGVARQRAGPVRIQPPAGHLGDSRRRLRRPAQVPHQRAFARDRPRLEPSRRRPGD